MKSIKKTKIIFTYQEARGGGSFAMASLDREFRKNSRLLIKTRKVSPIKNWGFWQFFGWLFKNIYFFFKFIVNEKNIDWIYTSTFITAYAASLLKPFKKYKICFHFHVLEIPENPYLFPTKSFFTQNLKIITLKLIYRVFLNQVDLIIVPSEFSKNYIADNFKLTRGKDFKVIYNGVQSRFFNPISTKRIENKKSELKIQSNEAVLTYSGRLEKNKNVKEMIQTFSEVIKKTKAKLQILYLKPNNNAEIAYKNELNSLVNKLGVQDKIIWSQNPKDLHLRYAMSDLILLLSKGEHLPLVMLESFATKTIFLSVPVGGTTEVINKINSDLLLDPTNSNLNAKKINSYLLMNSKDRRKIIDSEYDFVKKLTWKNISKQIFLELSKD